MASTNARGLTPADSAYVLAHLLKFSECKRSKGITDLHDPTNGPKGIGMVVNSNASNLQPDNPQFQASEAACQKFMGSNLTDVYLRCLGREARA